MSKCPYKNFKSKIADYISVLRQPRKEYNNMPACPFVGAEFDRQKLMIDIFDPSKSDIITMVQKFVESDHDSALFVQVANTQISADDTYAYQCFINGSLKKAGYDNLKCICFNPNDDVEIQGFNPRSHAPYFLINIAEKKVLEEAHEKLLNTKYFDNMNKKYLDFLKVKKKQLKKEEK